MNTQQTYRAILYRALIAQPKEVRRFMLLCIRNAYNREQCPKEFMHGRPSDRVRAAKASIQKDAASILDLQFRVNHLFPMQALESVQNDLRNLAYTATRVMRRRDWAIAVERASHSRGFWKKIETSA